MATAATVTVVGSFKLLPGRESVWEETYRDVFGKAKQNAATGLHWFHLLRDTHDDRHFAFISEWESAAAFDRFVREAGLIWDRRALEYSDTPAQVTYFERLTAGK